MDDAADCESWSADENAWSNHVVVPMMRLAMQIVRGHNLRLEDV